MLKELKVEGLSKNLAGKKHRSGAHEPVCGSWVVCRVNSRNSQHLGPSMYPHKDPAVLREPTDLGIRLAGWMAKPLDY